MFAGSGTGNQAGLALCRQRILQPTAGLADSESLASTPQGLTASPETTQFGIRKPGPTGQGHVRSRRPWHALNGNGLLPSRTVLQTTRSFKTTRFGAVIFGG